MALGYLKLILVQFKFITVVAYWIKNATMNNKKKVFAELRVYVLLFFVSFAIYLNALDGPFLHDDIKAIVENKDALVGTFID